jgi:L-iditol 2-dehydrogenase
MTTAFIAGTSGRGVYSLAAKAEYDRAPMSSKKTMQAAVYRGQDDVRIEEVPVPEIGPGEVLVKVMACGVCGTDIKKVQYGLLEPPRIFGHETAGVVAAVGSGVDAVREGDRVAVYHHVPDPTSWYGNRGLYAQDEQYKRTGVTAGFEPAGGGFAEYVRVMDWIVEHEGLVPVPKRASLEEAIFVEPVNTCLKAVRMPDLDEDEVVLVAGAGSIGLILMQLLVREGCDVVVTDPLPGRRARALELGATAAVDPREGGIAEACAELTDGRGADHAIVAAPGGDPIREAIHATRPGANIVLFASTRRGEEVPVDVGEICMSEKHIMGSYSASIDVAEEAAHVVFERKIDLAPLITHRFPLSETAEAIELAGHSTDDVLKVVVLPEGA